MTYRGPGECWGHFSHIEMDDYRSLRAGQRVGLEWEAPGQDGYDYRALRIVP
jgi:CspA family cold shock protein